MRIAAIGHSYHLKTRSNAFFLDLLSRTGEVETFVDASWERKSGSEWAQSFRQEDYDCVVVYQAHEAFAHLDLDHPNVVFVPMYDAMMVEGSFWWKQPFSRAKILCFSAALYREVSRLAPLRHYAQYFPNPLDYPEATPSGGAPSGFFWYRRQAITTDLLARLTGRTVFDRMTVHWAPDPVGVHREPRRLPRASVHERTSWFADRQGYVDRLASHSVFFAPRPYEGIGVGFLEAMAMGLCVVAPDLPTHNEYISHGVDGMLYSLAAPEPIDWSGCREMGRRARVRVTRGRELWERAEADVREFVATPRERLGKRRALIDFFHRAQSAPPAVESPSAPRLPKVTVVTVCKNAVERLPKTIFSVLEQDYPDFEYVVLDGGSTDGSVEILKRYAPRFAYWHSRPDQRAYAAMLESLDYARGEYVLFMHAGDVFASRYALSSLLGGCPPEADVVYGHHLFLRTDGVDELRLAREFEETWRQLRRGRLNQRWLEGIPCHQALAMRTSLLRERGFDPELRIAADHDLYFRLRRAGARFHHAAEVVAVYRGGGASAHFFDLCVQDWLRIAVRHGRSGPSRRFFRGSHLKPEQVWRATLRGWADRLNGRADRQFGTEYSALEGSSAFVRKSRSARWIERMVGPAAFALAWIERHMARVRALFGARVWLDGSEPVYRARWSDGIDFRRLGRPQFVARWSGLSYHEPWGRWSDGPQVEIQFDRPLPQRFDLVFDACAIGENTRQPIRVSFGKASREVRVPNEPMADPAQESATPAKGTGESPFQSIALTFEMSGLESVLTFEIPKPTSPAERWPGATGDDRALGLALQTLRIIER